MKKLMLTLAPLVFLAACGTSAETERKLAELEQVNAQKDSLMQEVAISSRLISDVNTELAKARIRNNRLHVSSESPAMAANDTLIAKLRYVVARVGETERAWARAATGSRASPRCPTACARRTTRPSAISSRSSRRRRPRSTC